MLHHNSIRFINKKVTKFIQFNLFARPIFLLFQFKRREKKEKENNKVNAIVHTFQFRIHLFAFKSCLTAYNLFERNL